MRKTAVQVHHANRTCDLSDQVTADLRDGERAGNGSVPQTRVHRDT